MPKPACTIDRPRTARHATLALLAILWLGLAAGAPAIDLDAIQRYDRAAHSQARTDCDRQAAHPDDPEAVAPGLGRAEMDLEAAAAACRAALADDPDHPRLHYQLARSLGYAGRHAGLVGFPHYYLMGQFADCADHPRIDRAEMLGFLDQAATSDFYKGALVEQLRARLLEQAEPAD